MCMGVWLICHRTTVCLVLSGQKTALLDAPELVLQTAVSCCGGSGRAVYLTAVPPVWPLFLKMGLRMGLEATGN